MKKLIPIIFLGILYSQRAFAILSANPSNLFINLKSNDFGSVMLYIIELLLGVVGVITLLFIIIGGFQYILSGANPDLAEQGKKTIKNAVIGLVIVILSYIIVVVVTNTFLGVNP